MKKVNKAYEILDAKISFVSLVDKAANQKQFLIAKSDKSDERGFATLGRIVKSDDATHYLTGIVYEPLETDAHDNFMTEDEIQKAAYWFAKNGDKVDMQHDFEECDSCTVVETWVAKADFNIGEEAIKKGTWLMTVEVTDDDIWEQVQKGTITGFSMGGVGKYSVDDVDVDSIEKGGAPIVEDIEKKGIFKKFAESLGFSVVEKGAMKDAYQEQSKYSNFWDAVHTLTSLLSKGRYDYRQDRYIYDFEEDEATLKEALEDFTEIITDVLSQKSIAKALLEAPPEKPITKAGKKMSGKNKQKLSEIMDSLAAFATDVNDEEEDTTVKKTEIQTMIDEAIQKALNPDPTPAVEEVDVTAEGIQKMIADAVIKATEKTPDVPPADTGSIEDMIAEAVAKAIEPVLKSRGLPSNLNNEETPIEKNDQHYLAGIL